MATIEQERQFYSSFMGEQDIDEKEFLTREEYLEELHEYNDAIVEIQCMIEYSLDVNDKNELKYWRRLLNQTKADRRKLVVNNKLRKE